MVFQQEMAGQKLSELEQLVQASGKMVLLDKLLPKLRAEGHKVTCPQALSRFVAHISLAFMTMQVSTNRSMNLAADASCSRIL